MEEFQRTKERTKERLRARRRARRNKLLLHGVFCSAIVIILLTITIGVLIANEELEHTQKIVIHSNVSCGSHYVVTENSLGEWIAIPDDEDIHVAYVTESADGKLNQAVYDALVDSVAELVQKQHLEIDDIVRHYDTSKEKCPEYFVEYESAWEDFKLDVEEKMKK